MLEIYINLCVTEPDFPGKYFLPQKLGKWTQNWPKIELFSFIGKFINFC